MNRNVKIVATVGPASQEESIVEKLLLAGVDVARLNFSHGDHQAHAERMTLWRQVAKRLGRPVAILQDLQGPKIRVGVLTQPLTLAVGQHVSLYPEGSPAPDDQAIPVDFPQLFDSVRPGIRILLDDGRLVLSVKQAEKTLVHAEVITGGVLTSNKGINLPGIRLDIPAFTEKDAEDLKFGLSMDVDAVAISFVRRSGDVMQVRNAITCENPTTCPLLIAKLERPEALDNLDAILEVVDGVMVARGDLGVEMAPEEVPGAQKRIIQAANRKGKLVITATQMLESMIHNPLPTRAEASDVANAVFDGTDAVMLSAETAAGEYPVEAVIVMDRIVRQAEQDFSKWGHLQENEQDDRNDAVALTHAARELAHDQDVSAIAVFTRMGRSALLMSKARPRVPILAFSPEERTYSRLAIAWGVQPHHIAFVNTVEEMYRCVEAALRESGMVQPGQQVVLVCGFPLGEMRTPNMALLHTIG
ncbi:MAG TPA: pyruvate kinase [Anaerolineales bacterium]|nr:pyruvate kinase [Anaerolineales bacterium]